MVYLALPGEDSVAMGQSRPALGARAVGIVAQVIVADNAQMAETFAMA